jgi:hypothetical protein
MDVTISFHKETFTADTRKQAYLEACKWVALHVMDKDEIGGHTQWHMTFDKEADSPTVILELFAIIDSNDAGQSFCKACKEFHKSFYINQQFNCDKCNYRAFKRRIAEKSAIKQAYRKENINRIKAKNNKDT